MANTHKLSLSSFIFLVVVATALAATTGVLIIRPPNKRGHGLTRVAAAPLVRPPTVAPPSAPPPASTRQAAATSPTTTAPAATHSNPVAPPARLPRPPTPTSPRPAVQNARPSTSNIASPVSTQGGSDPSHAGSYVFDRYNPDGTPTRFDPCSPIHVVTNLTEAPPGAAGMVATALSQLAAATGLQFIVDGSTDEIPQAGRPTVEARYGTGWAPVLIAWSHHGASDLLPGGSALGEGLGTWLGQGTVNSPLPPTVAYVTGEIAIDSQTTAHLTPGFGPGQTIGELLLHELGHLVGLGHTTDPTQIMYSLLLAVPVAAYGAGDLAGLRRLGAASGCLVNAPHPPAG